MRNFILKKIFKDSIFKTNKPLGRWGIHDYEKTELKLLYANEDHCGTCFNNKERLSKEEYYKVFII
jgi:hypothetical protein